VGLQGRSLRRGPDRPGAEGRVPCTVAPRGPWRPRGWRRSSWPRFASWWRRPSRPRGEV